MTDHATHQQHARRNNRLLTGLGITAGVVAAPHLLPHLGIGTMALRDSVLEECALSLSNGTGLAGTINQGLQAIPGIGPSLAAGSWTATIASGVLGLGGVLLGNYIQKHYDRPDHFPWGKVIKYAAIATSMLIALPSILSGVSMGLTYLAFLAGGGWLAYKTSVITGNTLGMMGGLSASTTGAAFSSFLPHLFTCGAAALPAVGSLFLGTRSADAEAYRMDLVSASPIAKGQPCELAFRLVDTQTGRELCPDNLTVTHTQKLHTMLVDSSLTDYHHLHPTYDPARKLFTCQFTPGLQQPYRAWHDLRLKGTAQNIQLACDLPVPRGPKLPATIRTASNVDANGIHAEIRADRPLQAQTDGMLSISLSGPDGQPLTNLEPIMGAYAHLVGFSADGKHFIHCHPIGPEPKSDAERGTGKLQFHITPEVAGPTKFFLQVRQNGQDVTLPFGQMIQPHTKFTSRVANAAAHHGHAMAMG